MRAPSVGPDSFVCYGKAVPNSVPAGVVESFSGWSAWQGSTVEVVTSGPPGHREVEI